MVVTDENRPGPLRHLVGWFRQVFMPTFGVAMVNGSAIIICIGVLVAGYLLVEPFPVSRVELVSVDPPDHVIDRSKFGVLRVTRRIVMRSTASLQITRTWIDIAGGITPSLDDFVILQKGDEVRQSVNIMPPASLNPGKHRYRVTLRWCNPLKCMSMQLEDVEIMILGNTPVDGSFGFQEHRF